MIVTVGYEQGYICHQLKLQKQLDILMGSKENSGTIFTGRRILSIGERNMIAD